MRVVKAVGAVVLALMLAWMVVSAVLMPVLIAQVHTVQEQHQQDDQQLISLERRYLAEQKALTSAGKEQDRFASWLVETDEALCKVTSATCPVVPTFSPLP